MPNAVTSRRSQGSKVIYCIGRKAGLSVEEAQDVVQETILSVCRSKESFKADPAYGSSESKMLQMACWKIAVSVVMCKETGFASVQSKQSDGIVDSHVPPYDRSLITVFSPVVFDLSPEVI